jgi:farnesyl-diphosphate farnesyltransferase
MVNSAIGSLQPNRAAELFCQEMLPEVSRTFSLSIRFLPGELGRAVLCAYLLCRIADTIEDDAHALPERKLVLLDRLMASFDDPDLAASLSVATVKGEAAHVRLVEHTHLVLEMFHTLPDRSKATVKQWVGEMVRGMKEFIGLYPQGIRIKTLAEYKQYCYYVAGTVGHLLTDLWYEHSDAIDRDNYTVLLHRCEAFGQALQTVNILKDIAWDAVHENSIYVPAADLDAKGSSHQLLLDPDRRSQNLAALSSLMDLARSDLDEALAYLLTVPKRAVSIRLFCILPLLFAYATLRELTNSSAMLQPGGSVKISRREVKLLIASGCLAIVSNRGIARLVDFVRRDRPQGLTSAYN